ncbi:MAG TPA: hypothetical protein VGA47_05135 [Candidatus Dormibacteraeota bacterium]
MDELQALATMWIGVAIAAIGAVGGTISLVRMALALDATKSQPTERRVAAIHHTSWMMLSAVIAAVGLNLVILGGVIGFGLPIWAPILPGVLLIGAALIAGYLRWLLNQERRRATGRGAGADQQGN